MKLPWVSRSAYETLEKERDYLRSKLDAALDHNRRVERRDAGMTEEPKPIRKLEPMPREAILYLRELHPAGLRKLTEADFRASYKDTGSWATVLQLLKERETE